MPSDIPLLRLKGLAKTYPNGAVALKRVGLDIESGQVHGLLGANGAGKSTLIKILCGAIQATSGEIEWKGKPVKLEGGPRAANDLGIATIHQHVPLVPTLSVLENVFLSDEGWRRTSSDHASRYHRLCDRIGYHLDPDVLVSDLPIGQRQMVAILTALVSGAELIVMDEPTASLATEERELVYRTVRHLSSKENKAVLFVSHFLDEVVDLTDRVTVIRDGVVALEAPTRDLDEGKIAEAIVGREVVALERQGHTRPALATDGAQTKPLLELQALASPGKFEPVTLKLAAGEVLGIAGLLGSGRSELVHAIFGADPQATGQVLLEGRPLRRSTRASVGAGVALVPEDRLGQGLVPGFEIWRNVTLPALESVSWMGFVPQRIKEVARGVTAIRRLAIRAESPEVLVSELSGGNAQKTTIAKWLFSDVKLFLLDEPTAGIDIGAKTDILKLIRALAGTGKAVVVVSSEFEELLAVSDRIIVLRDGKVAAERLSYDTTEHQLMLLAGGERLASDKSNRPGEDSAMRER